MRKPLVVAALTFVLTGCDTDDGSGGDPASSTPSVHGEHTSQPAAEQAPAPDVERFTVRGGKRVDGPARLEVALGDKVAIEVTSDTADELHVHGYDKTVKVEPGKPAKLEFTADQPGVWEIELHDGGGVLTQLRVS